MVNFQSLLKGTHVAEHKKRQVVICITTKKSFRGMFEFWPSRLRTCGQSRPEVGITVRLCFSESYKNCQPLQPLNSPIERSDTMFEAHWQPVDKLHPADVIHCIKKEPLDTLLPLYGFINVSHPVKCIWTDDFCLKWQAFHRLWILRLNHSWCISQQVSQICLLRTPNPSVCRFTPKYHSWRNISLP